MALTLKTVEAGHGPRWIGDAFRLFARQPLAFLLMTLVFFAVCVVLPLVAMPLLSLGFMVAAQSALLDGPVHPRQFIDPLRTDAARRRTLLLMCVAYAVAMVLALLAADALSGHAMGKLRLALAQGQPSTAELEAVMPDATAGAMFTLLFLGIVSIPFWHAPALVHWGGQGLSQALFSSTLALWRGRGAYALYTLCWGVLLMGAMLLAGIVAGALGLQDTLALIVLAGWMLVSALFYISVLFSFNDSFGNGQGQGSARPADEPAPPAP